MTELAATRYSMTASHVPKASLAVRMADYFPKFYSTMFDINFGWVGIGV